MPNKGAIMSPGMFASAEWNRIVEQIVPIEETNPLKEMIESHIREKVNDGYEFTYDIIKT